MTTETILTANDIRQLKIKTSVVGPDDFFNKVARAIEQAVLQSPEVQRLREERDTLHNELSDLIRGYINLLESGRDRIRDFGGDCDPVDVMESNDPWLRSARKTIAAMEKQHD